MPNSAWPTKTHIFTALVLTALMAPTVNAQSRLERRPGLGVTFGTASRPSAGSRGVDLALAGEAPLGEIRVRAEAGIAAMEAGGPWAPSLLVRRTTVGVVRFVDGGNVPAGVFLGLGAGYYRYRASGLERFNGVAGYVAGGIEIPGRRRAVTVEFRLNAPLDGATAGRPWYGGFLIGLKRKL